MCGCNLLHIKGKAATNRSTSGDHTPPAVRPGHNAPVVQPRRVLCGTSRLDPRHPRKHLAVAVAVDEQCGNIELEDTEWLHPASDDDAVQFRVTDPWGTASSARGRMNIVDGREAHSGIPLRG
jgi:hypothetical protein